MNASDPAQAAAGGAQHSVLQWLGSRKHRVDPAIEPVINELHRHHPKAPTEIIERAYVVAKRAHEGQTRKSGEPYITHPVAVALILAELGMTPVTLAAALLHDTVEDTAYRLTDLTEEFGPDIALLVDGVTKLEKVNYGDAAQAETVRKMVVAMSKDIRVLIIKLGDRLHNARTWKYVSSSSAKRKARETLEIYAPLAHRLGMNTIKWELEDLSFSTLYPEVYQEIVHLVSDRAPARSEYLKNVLSRIEDVLKDAGIEATVTGRPKHYYSIYQKMIVRGRDFDDIYDLVGIRVLVESVSQCYGVLGALHGCWKPLPGRFKDYISVPKFNLYQSLHTTLLGPGGKPIEIQIRTYEMHKAAEFGVAAHWKYKEDPNATQHKPGQEGDTSPQDMRWLRQLVDWQRETQDPAEFLESLRYEMASAEVYVFTPKGDVISLPSGATPIDFAYAVHTEVGHHTVGARVNGTLVPLETQLDNGDTVEVFTSKAEKSGPSRDWLTFVASPRARNKIRAWFSKERREEAVETGKTLIAKAMRKQNLPIQRLMSHQTLTGLADELRYADVSAMYAAVGEKHLAPGTVVTRLIELVGGDSGAEEDLAEATIPGQVEPRRASLNEPNIIVEGMEQGDMWVKLARCCTPVPGDPIQGFITRGSGVSVHREDCANIDHLRREPERIIPVHWGEHNQGSFLVQVIVKAIDRSGLLSDITKILSENHVNIHSATSSTNRDRLAILRFIFELGDAKHMSHILHAIEAVDGVYEASRVRPGGRRRSRS
ncbi:MAG: bifunctional (p)ppGpp synthetase/guanosine-3',5'-bis(diphosphate) 3'-pyrophosphohydrolase [Bowdeniella nasicola]|nr:bifunctional (p)ppGpp synthetase/guanosine-3',5'-bis(diphosphate) 3'-pyrophosphohydrolase [Bowdeniella nasicola]